MKLTGYSVASAISGSLPAVAGGAGCENIIRRQALHSDFGEFILCFETWRTRFPHDPPVSTTIEDSTVPLPVPGATLVLDLWAYIP